MKFDNGLERQKLNVTLYYVTLCFLTPRRRAGSSQLGWLSYNYTEGGGSVLFENGLPDTPVATGTNSVRPEGTKVGLLKTHPTVLCKGRDSGT